MKQRTLATVAVTLALLVAGGCAGNDASVAKDPVAATLPAEQTSPSSDGPKKPKNITNAIVAIVNDEIITLYDVNREAQPAISEAEKKAPLNDATRSQIRRTALNRLIEKKLTEQKIRELNIRVSEEEISKASRRLAKTTGIKAWYPTPSDCAWPTSVLICQRSNAVWARRQHRTYAVVLICGAMVWAA